MPQVLLKLFPRLLSLQASTRYSCMWGPEGRGLSTGGEVADNKQLWLTLFEQRPKVPEKGLPPANGGDTNRVGGGRESVDRQDPGHRESENGGGERGKVGEDESRDAPSDESANRNEREEALDHDPVPSEQQSTRFT